MAMREGLISLPVAMGDEDRSRTFRRRRRIGASEARSAQVFGPSFCAPVAQRFGTVCGGALMGSR